jgi:transaldolase
MHDKVPLSSIEKKEIAVKIFLDTADPVAIKQWAILGIIDGITSNPSHLAHEGGDPYSRIQEILHLLPYGQISVQVTEKDSQKIYNQAHEIAKISSNILVKIPCHQDYYAVIKCLADDGVALNITLVFTVIQALYMCKLGVHYISPFIGRLDDSDEEGIELLFQIRSMIDSCGFNTQLLAASLRTVRHVHQAIMAGADALTIPVEIFEKSVQHTLTDQGMTRFDVDWARLGVRKFP